MSEPEVKKQKTGPTGWEKHEMNISEAVMKSAEGKHLVELVNSDATELQGIGPVAQELLKALKVDTVADLATYKFFLLARAIKTLAETETKDGRVEGSIMNIDKAVDKDWEAKSLNEILAAPTGALEGLSSEASKLFDSLGVKSVSDLADFKFCRWAEAIVHASEFEEDKTTKERKIEAALKKLDAA